MAQTEGTRKALSLDEVADLLGIGRTLAWRLPRLGLRTIKVGGRRLVRPADLDAWLEQQAAAPNREVADYGALLGKKAPHG